MHLNCLIAHSSYPNSKFTGFFFFFFFCVCVCVWFCFVIVVLLCDVTYEKLCVYEKSSLWIFCQLHTCKRAPPDHMELTAR